MISKEEALQEYLYTIQNSNLYAVQSKHETNNHWVFYSTHRMLCEHMLDVPYLFDLNEARQTYFEKVGAKQADVHFRLVKISRYVQPDCKIIITHILKSSL